MAYIGNIPAVQYASFSKQTLTPDSSTTSFTLDNAVANENELEVFVNNVRQEPGSGNAYTASGTTLTMSAAPTTGDSFYVIFQGKATQTVTAPAGSVTTSQLADLAVTSGKLASGVLPTNTPTFHAYLSANQTSISGNSSTKVQINTEVLDTDGNYDNSTNYRFTPTTAGKYFVYANLVAEFDTDKLFQIQAQIFKNGSSIVKTDSDFADNSISKLFAYVSTIVDMNGSSDYLEFYGLIDRYAGGTTTGTFYGGTPQQTYFGGYKIIT